MPDGSIGVDEYGNQPDAPHLLETHGRKDPEYPAQFRVAYDDKALYVAVTAAERSGEKMSPLAQQRDDPNIRKQNYVELVVQPTADVKSRRQFAVNRAGIQYDALGGDPKWDARWTATALPDDGDFVVEFAIPFESLGMPAPKRNDQWALNVFRGRGASNPKWEQFSQWVMTYANFNSATHLGVLRFK